VKRASVRRWFHRDSDPAVTQVRFVKEQNCPRLHFSKPSQHILDLVYRSTRRGWCTDPFWRAPF
jgi:hypothetical protein